MAIYCLDAGAATTRVCLAGEDAPRVRVPSARGDNEQTPQIWTTCADVQVVEKKESGAEARHRGVGLLCSMAAVAAAKKVVVEWCPIANRENEKGADSRQ